MRRLFSPRARSVRLVFCVFVWFVNNPAIVAADLRGLRNRNKFTPKRKCIRMIHWHSHFAHCCISCIQKLNCCACRKATLEYNWCASVHKVSHRMWHAIISIPQSKGIPHHHITPEHAWMYVWMCVRNADLRALYDLNESARECWSIPRGERRVAIISIEFDLSRVLRWLNAC